MDAHLGCDFLDHPVSTGVSKCLKINKFFTRGY